MISHLCNALIYNSGLFSGFTSALPSGGQTNLFTEGGDQLTTEDGDNLLAENQTQSNTGGFGYIRSYVPVIQGFSLSFQQTGQTMGNSGFENIDCGTESCPANPITKLSVTWTESSPYTGLNRDWYQDETFHFYLRSLINEQYGYPEDQYFWETITDGSGGTQSLAEVGDAWLVDPLYDPYLNYYYEPQYEAFLLFNEQNPYGTIHVRNQEVWLFDKGGNQVVIGKIE